MLTDKVDGIWIARRGFSKYTIFNPGVEFFIYFYKENSYNSTNTELPLYKLSSQILPVLFQVFASAEE